MTFNVLTDSSTLALSRLLTALHKHILFSLSYSGKICHILLRAVYKLCLWFHSHGLEESQGGTKRTRTMLHSSVERGTEWITEPPFSFPQMWTRSTSQSLNCLRNDFDSPQWIRPWYSLIKSFRDLFIGQFTRLHTSCQLVTQLHSSNGSCSVQTQDFIH